MAKKSKTYDMTFVYDIFHDVDKPISPSMLGKIRKTVDNIEILNERHIRVTCNGMKLTTSANPIDEIRPFADHEEADMNTLLHSCSRFLRIHKIQVFVL